MDSKVKKRLFWAILFSIGFMVFLLAKVEWKHFALIGRRLDIMYLAIAFSIFVLGNLVRTFRFHQLDHSHRKLTQWWNINSFYNFITSTLPGGAGEAATAYVLKRYSMFNLLGAVRILLLSRLMDLFAISGLFFLVSILIRTDTPYRETAMWLTGILFIMTSIALTPASERFLMRLLQWLPGNISFIEKASNRLNELLEIAKERQSVRYNAITLMQSTVAIIGAIATLYLLLRSLGVDLTPIQSGYCFGVYAVFQIIPIQGIAGIGTKAAWFSLALNAAGYQGEEVVALGFVLHGIYYLFITILGLSAFVFWLLRRE